MAASDDDDVHGERLAAPRPVHHSDVESPLMRIETVLYASDADRVMPTEKVPGEPPSEIEEPPQRRSIKGSLKDSSTSDRPERRIQKLIIKHGRTSLDRITHELNWSEKYHDTYGDLKEFILSYNVLFVLSPVRDEVVLRNSGSGEVRRPKLSRQMHISAPLLASCAYTSVSESFDIAHFEDIYQRRGLVTRVVHGVLQVTFKGVFDVFIFDTGSVVWWGSNRADHWIVDDDFIEFNIVTSPAIHNRHSRTEIAELYPMWCTYQEDPTLELDPQGDNEAAVERFCERLTFDFFHLPKNGAAEVKLAISFALSVAAKIDFYEYVTESKAKEVARLPTETNGLLSYVFNKSERLKPTRLAGELRSAQLMLLSITQEPLFLWEMPFLKRFVFHTLNNYSVSERRAFFDAKADAQYEMINNISSRHHRVFMIRSDFFLICLLVADVLFMLLRLIVTLFFSVPSKDSTML